MPASGGEPVTISEPVVVEAPIVVSDEVLESPEEPIVVNDEITETSEEPITVIEESSERIEGGVTTEVETAEEDLIINEFAGPADPIRRQQVLTRNRIVGSVILFFIILWFAISKLLTVIKKHDKLITSIDLSLDQEPENDVKPLDPTPTPTPTPTETYFANPQVGTDNETSLGEKPENK